MFYVSLHSHETNQASRKQVRIRGHVSKPIFGEGRQTPDRQMFYVNSRPCGMPQLSKVMNEVYKSYNLSQSPFIFANVLLDTSTSIGLCDRLSSNHDRCLRRKCVTG